MTELQTLLQEIVKTGNGILGTSFKAVPGAVGSSDIITNITLPPWVSTDWTFTAMRWGNQGTPQAPGVPPWAIFQPSFAAPQALPGSILTLGAFGVTDAAPPAATGPLLRISWGTGNVLETAWIDYPIAGVTVGGLHGSQLRVNVDNLIFTPAGGVPILGGWASPGQSTAKRSSDPVLTYSGIVMTAGTTVHAYIPPRARAYRVYSPDAITGNNWWNTGVAVQSFAGGTPIARDMDMANSQWSTVMSESSRMCWMPLDPRATRVDLSTTGTITTTTVGLQWLIDLG
jgi:hypothetical protein